MNRPSETVFRIALEGERKGTPVRVEGTVQNQFAAAGRWLRGTMHCHLEGAWVDRAPEAYREMGYDFMPGMDHSHGVVKLKDVKGLTVIPGAELGPGHLLVYGLDDVSFLSSGAGGENRLDRTVKMIRLAAEKGGLPFLAHPLWSGWRWEELRALCEAGLCGLEVICGPESPGDTGHADQLWHQLLAPGVLLAAIGGDDTSGPEGLAEKGRPGGRYRRDLAWTGVLAADSSPAGVLEAIRRGRTYASTGPEFHSVALQADGKLVVRCSPCAACHFRSRQAGYGGTSVYAPGDPGTAEVFVFDFARSAFRARDHLVVILEDGRKRKAYLSPLKLDLRISPF